MNNTYHEKEVKYLLNINNHKLSINNIVEVLMRLGYKWGPRWPEGTTIHKRTKLEEYFDDSNFSLFKRGDILRSTRHIWYNRKDITPHNFMYKKKISDPSKIYVQRIEQKNNDIRTLYEFIDSFGIDIMPDETPKLKAVMLRYDAVMVNNETKIYVVYDRTTYQSPDGNDYTEEMLEIEDKIDQYEDRHLYRINDEMIKYLPIRLTKENKYERGCKNLLVIK